MITSFDYFERCVALCRQHGLGRVEVGNRYMVAWTRLYRNENHASAEEALSACEAAVLVGHQRAEIVARLTAARALYELGDLVRGKEQIATGLGLVDELGATRFKPFFAIFLARATWAERGDDPAVRDMLNEALEISRETGRTFVGPWVLSTLALVTDRPEARRRSLDDGEAILRESCVGHNYLAFYPDAIQIALDQSDWDAVERYGAALEDYTRPEPLPRTDFFIARGRALAAFGRGRRDEASLGELARLRDVAARAGLRAALPALEAALEAA